jgi:hypothetical protein
VGIGTTPTEKFHIGGGGTFFHQGASYASMKGYEVSSGGNTYRITTAASGEELELVTGGVATQGLHIDDAGNVGIGTTNPGYKLDVQGDIRTSGGVPMYTNHQYCDNPGTPSLSSTCQTRACGDGLYLGYFPGNGTCQCGSDCLGGPCPATCPNTYQGRLWK